MRAYNALPVFRKAVYGLIEADLLRPEAEIEGTQAPRHPFSLSICPKGLSQIIKMKFYDLQLRDT